MGAGLLTIALINKVTRMNLIPLAGFYFKHGSQIKAMAGNHGPSTLLLDVATAVIPVIKKHFPQFNADNLCDDALTTLKEVLGTPAA